MQLVVVQQVVVQLVVVQQVVVQLVGVQQIAVQLVVVKHVMVLAGRVRVGGAGEDRCWSDAAFHSTAGYRAADHGVGAWFTANTIIYFFNDPFKKRKTFF